MTKSDDNKRIKRGTFTAALLAGSGLSAQGQGHLETPTEPAIKISAPREPRERTFAEASHTPSTPVNAAAPLTPLAPDGIPDPAVLLLVGGAMVGAARFAGRRRTPTVDDQSKTR